MVRLAISGLALVAALLGCTSSSRRVPEAQAPPRSFVDPEFATEEQKILACLDLQDHIVDLYATEYVSKEGVAMSSSERTAFRDGWADELAKRGTFERFEHSCFSGLTPGKYRCGMQSQTTDGLVACMKLSAR
jgi:hypothetical protein